MLFGEDSSCNSFTWIYLQPTMFDAWAEDHPVLSLASGNPSVCGQGWRLLHSIPVL